MTGVIYSGITFPWVSTKRPRRLVGKRPLTQPLLRRTQQNHVLIFPDKLMRCAGNLDKHLLARSEICAERSHVCSGGLRIEVGPDERWNVNLPGRNKIEPPSGVRKIGKILHLLDLS